MPDVIDSTRSKRLTTKEISENSASILKGAASDLVAWASWLVSVAQHPNESANNCAAIMASPYEDKRELRNASGWEALGGSVKEGERGIPLVHRSKSGNFFVDIQYPASAVDGAREHYRGLPVKIDLADEVDGPAFAAALDKWGADLDDASPNVGFVVFARYGIDGAPAPELPDPAIVADAKQLAAYCSALKRDAENLVFKFDATIDAARRNIMSPKTVAEQGPEVEAEQARKADAEGPERRSVGDGSGLVAPSPNREPAAAYAAASAVAKIASEDKSEDQSIGSHI